MRAAASGSTSSRARRPAVTSPLLLRVAFWTGVLGFAASLAVHLATFTAYAPPGLAVALHAGALVAFVPVFFALKAWAEGRGHALDGFGGQRALQRDLLGLLRTWEKAALAALAVYAAVNFAVGVAAVMAEPEAGFSFRLFSGHWLFLYFASAVLARRFLDLGPAVAELHEV